MNIKKKKLFLLFCIVLSILFCTYVWDLISIDFGKNQIVGEYFEKKHNALNDPLRYFFFIVFPLTVYFLFQIFFEKKKINFEHIKVKNFGFEKNNKLKIINFYIIFILIFEFFSINFPVNLIDIFHEGQKLSAAFKSSMDGKLWSGSFVTTGIINETLGTKLIWKIFNHQSIGLMRYLEIIYILIFKISLIYLFYLIINNIFFSLYGKIAFFLTTSIISFFLIDYNLSTGDSFSYRDLPTVFFLIIFFKYLSNMGKFYFPLLLIGFLSVTSFFWSIDRALIVNFLIIFMYINMLLNKRYAHIATITLSIIFFWVFYYYYLGFEFNYFLNNTLSVLSNQNYIHGIIHPTPFSNMDNSSRATKSLLLIILSLLISSSFFFSEKKKYNNFFKLVLITLSFAGFCSYLYALSRSDGGHIKQTTGVLVIFFSLFIFYHLIRYLEKFILYKKFNISFLHFSSLILIILFFFIPKINIKNTIEYSKRLKQFVYLEDESFLTKNQNEFVNIIQPLTKKYKCLQLFTYDAALIYLLKIPNCSIYYFTYSLGSINEQNKLINTMKEINLIIYSGQTDNWGTSPQIKLPLVDNYINSNFLNNIKILNWEVKVK
jgi:hypothetical protein